MFSFRARRKGGGRKKVEIIFPLLKQAEEQLAGSIFPLSTDTHAFCHLVEIRIWFKFPRHGKKSLTLHIFWSDPVSLLCWL